VLFPEAFVPMNRFKSFRGIVSSRRLRYRSALRLRSFIRQTFDAKGVHSLGLTISPERGREQLRLLGLREPRPPNK
jgi:hypothetical protein